MHTMSFIFKSGIHPCISRIAHAFLAFQGNLCKVSDSFRNVSVWVSFLLLLSGDISLNPGPVTRNCTECLLNIRSNRNKSGAFVDFVNTRRLT